MVRPGCLMLGIALALSACSSSGSSSAEGSTIDRDRAAIVQLFRGANEAWQAGRSAGIEYEVAHNYEFPDFTNVTVKRANRCLAPNLRRSYEVDPTSLRATPGWEFAPAHAVPRGRIYAVDVVETASGFPGGGRPTRSRFHATVLTDGKARHFFGVDCSWRSDPARTAA